MDLIETSKLMRTQSNRHTQYPLFVVHEELEVVQAQGCGDYTKYISEDGEHEFTQEQYDAIEEAQDNENQESVEELLEELGFENLYDINLRDFRAVEFELQSVMSDRAGFFFTEKACHDHIEQNHYHYTKPRSYVISAWRNPEIVATMQMILNLTTEADGLDIPSCYK